MVTIVGVRFRSSGKVYYFDPGEFDLVSGVHVIVDTARGMEFGEVTSEPQEMSEKSVVKPLRKVVRIADENDEQRHDENMSRKQEALEICQERILEHDLEMKLIDVEYTFDNSKIVFYFTADGRVDFRELVKDLAGIFRMRIELRQVGVRDEARMLGGIGECGRSLCCHQWLGRFNPVSIKMAKTQGLSLNPAKISGICGRLMCCLKFENDTYCELCRGMPRQGEHIDTPDGRAVVIDTNTLKQEIRVRHVLGTDPDSAQGEEILSDDMIIYSKEALTNAGRYHRDVRNGREDRESRDRREERSRRDDHVNHDHQTQGKKEKEGRKKKKTRDHRRDGQRDRSEGKPSADPEE